MIDLCRKLESAPEQRGVRFICLSVSTTSQTALLSWRHPSIPPYVFPHHRPILERRRMNRKGLAVLMRTRMRPSSGIVPSISPHHPVSSLLLNILPFYLEWLSSCLLSGTRKNGVLSSYCNLVVLISCSSTKPFCNFSMLLILACFLIFKDLLDMYVEIKLTSYVVMACLFK